MKNFKYLAIAGVLATLAGSAKADNFSGNLLSLGAGSTSINFDSAAAPLLATGTFGYHFAFNFENFVLAPGASFYFNVSNFKDKDARKTELAGLGALGLDLAFKFGYSFEGKAAILFKLACDFRFNDKIKGLAAEEKAAYGLVGFKYGAEFVIPVTSYASFTLGADVTLLNATKEAKDTGKTVYKDNVAKAISTTAGITFNF
ncbi:hypothetical protein FACS1894152_4260 [Bacilli bacterium]|nr:hypothetical protein FACS1894152_4260 [Bacilli bacterium]